MHFAKIALVLCAVLVSNSFAVVTNQLLLSCNSTFFNTLAADAAPKSQCNAYSALNLCLTQVVLQASPSSLQLIVSDSEDIVTYALATTTTCDVYSMSFGPLTSNVPINLAKGDNVKFTQYTAKTVGAGQQAEELNEIAEKRSAFTASTAANTAAAGTSLKPIGDAVSRLIDNMFTSTLDKMTARITSISNRINNLSTAAAAIPATVTTAQAAINTQLSSETSARTVLTAQWAASMTPLEAAITTRTTAANTDRSNIRASRNNNNPATTISTMFSSQTVTEASRSTAEAATQSSTFATLRTSMSSTISTRLSSEMSRSDSTCTAKVATITFTVPVTSNATQDEDVCASSSAGQLYYSRLQNVMYLCNGANWIPFLPSYSTSGFACSGILNAYQQDSLSQTYGRQYSYNRCFASTVHGYSSSTMYSQCQNKGLAALFVMRNNYGIIHGGYTDGPLQNTGSWKWTGSMTTFRFSPQNSVIELLYPYGYGSGTYGFLDSISYCPMFGNGYDTYVSSSCQSGYTYCYTYFNSQINFWQTSSYCSWYTPNPSSLSVSAVEVWIQF